MSNLDSAIANLRKTERDGSFFLATEIAYELLRENYLDEKSKPDPSKLDDGFYEVAHLLTRAVLNCRAVDRAEELYKERYKLNKKADDFDIRSLGARLVKEQALLASGPERRKLLRKAELAYAGIYEDFDRNRPYTSVNAATMCLLRGDDEAAGTWARSAIKLCQDWQANSPVEVYYKAVTIAEACLILGDVDNCGTELVWAKKAGLDETATLVTTYRQLKLICDHKGLNPDATLAPIRTPDIVFYAGHIIEPEGQEGRFPAHSEQEVSDAIHTWLDTNEVSTAYGSLAAGSDILFAEAFLKRNVNLHVFLPFSQDDFIRTSVIQSGEQWVDRFNWCLARCSSDETGSSRVSYATRDAFLNDETLFDYGSRYAMGVAMLKAGHLMTQARLLVVYDGRGGSEYGTGKMVEYWRKKGLRADIIQLPKAGTPRERFISEDNTPALPKRVPKAVLFGDVVGFSDIKEQDVPRFHEHFMKPLADELAPYKDRIKCINSWGDAIYVVFDEVTDAARYSFEVQRRIRELNFIPEGKKNALSMRIAMHYGPVFDSVDGFIQEPSCYGAHVTQAARIEPSTPPGAVYVTEAMAAELELTEDSGIVCEFVGPISSAKKYGDLLLYVLREEDAPAAQEGREAQTA